MNILLSMLLFLEIVSTPTQSISLSQYIDRNNKNETKREVKLEKSKEELEKEKQLKIEEERKNNPYNLEYIKYMGNKKGTEVKELLKLSLNKYNEYIKNNGEKITIQFNDLISKSDMDKEKYLEYLNKSIQEVDISEDYVVGVEYNEKNNISKITVMQKDKIE